MNNLQRLKQRQQKAETMLDAITSDPLITLAELTDLVGYSEIPTTSKTFRDCVGMTITEARRKAIRDICARVEA